MLHKGSFIWASLLLLAVTATRPSGSEVEDQVEIRLENPSGETQSLNNMKASLEAAIAKNTEVDKEIGLSGGDGKQTSAGNPLEKTAESWVTAAKKANEHLVKIQEELKEILTELHAKDAEHKKSLVGDMEETIRKMPAHLENHEEHAADHKTHRTEAQERDASASSSMIQKHPAVTEAQAQYNLQNETNSFQDLEKLQQLLNPERGDMKVTLDEADRRIGKVLDTAKHYAVDPTQAIAAGHNKLVDQAFNAQKVMQSDHERVKQIEAEHTNGKLEIFDERPSGVGVPPPEAEQVSPPQS
mmetsp:Transcript_147196/g.256915  ORF Transcript_147196/g.256915 Transcript_147196/m.256915 type:complete len:300 (-) Transcript_147196:64-963(-)